MQTIVAWRSLFVPWRVIPGIKVLGILDQNADFDSLTDILDRGGWRSRLTLSHGQSLVPYQTARLAKLGHSKLALHPFWQGRAGLCRDLSFPLQAQGIWHRVFCVCETERDGERVRGEARRESMWQPWLSWLGKRERGWNRFIPRLVALHAFTHTYTHCCVFICLSLTVLECRNFFSVWETESSACGRHCLLPQMIWGIIIITTSICV